MIVKINATKRTIAVNSAALKQIGAFGLCQALSG
jgi:hypothetical protein